MRTQTREPGSIEEMTWWYHFPPPPQMKPYFRASSQLRLSLSPKLKKYSPFHSRRPPAGAAASSSRSRSHARDSSKEPLYSRTQKNRMLIFTLKASDRYSMMRSVLPSMRVATTTIFTSFRPASPRKASASSFIPNFRSYALSSVSGRPSFRLYAM